MTSNLSPYPALRTEADSLRTKAGLLVGLLLCAGSSALTIWLATLLF